MIQLKDVMIKPEAWREYAGPSWSREEIKEALKCALWDMAVNSFYAPYIERYPVALDEELPKSIQEGLQKEQSFACTDSQKVFYDTELAKPHYEKLMKEVGKTDEILKEVESVLAHEYTHIICEHRAIAEALFRRYKERVPQAVGVCHTIACEIQANRGARVNKKSLIYQCGVTEDAFPETKGLVTYSEIFSALLRVYNKRHKEMKQMMEKIKDMVQDEIAKQMKDGKGKGKGEGKDKGKDGEDGSGKGAGKIFGKKTKEVEEHELTEEEIKKAIDNAENSEQEVYNELVEFGGGYGLDKVNDEKLELNPDRNANTEYQRWEEQRIKSELKRMKGYVRGSFSREREKTYSRPTRRSIDPNSKLIRKGIRNGKGLMPRVLVAMDSSGSMGGTPVTTVATAIGNLFKDLGRPTEGCYIVKHESRCSEAYPLSKWEEVVESFQPSGGNCFNNVVRLANALNVDVVFNIGDGCDCCIRNYNDDGDKICREFTEAGRKWVDTLILDKKDNYYFDGEWTFDHNNGFEREVLQLGKDIAQYL